MKNNAGNGVRSGLLLLLFPALLFILPRPAGAQPTNLEVYQQLAVECLSEVPAAVPAFVLDTPAEMPYLRPALTSAWQDSGKTIYLSAAVAEDTLQLPRFSYRITEASVTYDALDRRRWRRTAQLAVQYTIVDADGRLLREASCSRQFTDEIPAGSHGTLELDLYPETTAEPPAAGMTRRFVEPVVIGAAISIMAYLFFSVRSRSDQQQ